jgi:hypothetical protein
MTTVEVVKGRWYPRGAPALPGEIDETWTDRMLGAQGEDRRPYDHSRNRQCSIKFHDECSDRDHSGQCECPCHDERRHAEPLAAEFNQHNPVGTVVSLIECDPPEPDVATTSVAYVDGAGWPVVELATFPTPVWLSWLRLS